MRPKAGPPSPLVDSFNGLSKVNLVFVFMLSSLPPESLVLLGGLEMGVRYSTWGSSLWLLFAVGATTAPSAEAVELINLSRRASDGSCDEAPAGWAGDDEES